MYECDLHTSVSIAMWKRFSGWRGRVTIRSRKPYHIIIINWLVYMVFEENLSLLLVHVVSARIYKMKWHVNLIFIALINPQIFAFEFISIIRASTWHIHASTCYNHTHTPSVGENKRRRNIKTLWRGKKSTVRERLQQKAELMKTNGCACLIFLLFSSRHCFTGFNRSF